MRREEFMAAQQRLQVDRKALRAGLTEILDVDAVDATYSAQSRLDLVGSATNIEDKYSTERRMAAYRHYIRMQAVYYAEGKVTSEDKRQSVLLKDLETANSRRLVGQVLREIKRPTISDGPFFLG